MASYMTRRDFSLILSGVATGCLRASVDAPIKTAILKFSPSGSSDAIPCMEAGLGDWRFIYFSNREQTANRADFFVNDILYWTVAFDHPIFLQPGDDLTVHVTLASV